MNDALRTDAFVRYDPETIACACIWLAARLLKYPLPEQPPWYLVLRVKQEHIEDVATSILMLYSRKKVGFLPYLVFLLFYYFQTYGLLSPTGGVCLHRIEKSKLSLHPIMLPLPP